MMTDAGVDAGSKRMFLCMHMLSHVAPGNREGGIKLFYWLQLDMGVC